MESLNDMLQLGHEPNDEQRQSYRSTLLGLALADAIAMGTKHGNSSTPIMEPLGSQKLGVPAGGWSDETSMALVLAASLIEIQEFNADDVMIRLKRWKEKGYMSAVQDKCIEIDDTVAEAIENYSVYDSERSPYCGLQGKQHKSGICVAYIPAIAMFYLHCYPADIALETAERVARLTHTSPACIDVCRYYTAILMGLFHGETKQKLLCQEEIDGTLRLYTPPGVTDDYWNQHCLSVDVIHMLERVAKGNVSAMNDMARYLSEKDVIYNVELALTTFLNTETFNQGLYNILRKRGQVDTVGAIYGALCGAHTAQLPENFLKKLIHRDFIEETANELFACAHYLSKTVHLVRDMPRPIEICRTVLWVNRSEYENKARTFTKMIEQKNEIRVRQFPDTPALKLWMRTYAAEIQNMCATDGMLRIVLDNENGRVEHNIEWIRSRNNLSGCKNVDILIYCEDSTKCQNLHSPQNRIYVTTDAATAQSFMCLSPGKNMETVFPRDSFWTKLFSSKKKQKESVDKGIVVIEEDGDDENGEFTL